MGSIQRLEIGRKEANQGINQAGRLYAREFNSTVDKINELISFVNSIKSGVEDLVWEHRLISFVDRGQWQSNERYYYMTVNWDLNPFALEVSCVWHYGCKWQCLADGTADEPTWQSHDWAMVEGDPCLHASFAEPEQLYDLDNLQIPLTLKLRLYNQDVTGGITDADVMWTRYTEDENGNQQAASDTIWATTFAASGRSGKAVVLGIGDIGVNAGRLPKKCVFTATATLADGMQAAASLDVGI